MLWSDCTAMRRRQPALDCYELMMSGETTNGVYDIFLKRSNKYIKVFCDMTSGGWTVGAQVPTNRLLANVTDCKIGKIVG